MQLTSTASSWQHQRGQTDPTMVPSCRCPASWYSPACKETAVIFASPGLCSQPPSDRKSLRPLPEDSQRDRARAASWPLDCHFSQEAQLDSNLTRNHEFSCAAPRQSLKIETQAAAGPINLSVKASSPRGSLVTSNFSRSFAGHETNQINKG